MTERTTTGNSTYNKLAAQCSAVRQLAEVNQTLVLRINPDSYRDGKNRHLRQAAKHQTVKKLKMKAFRIE